MLVFALIVAPSDEAGKRKFEWIKKNAIDLLPFKASAKVEWQASKSPVSVRAIAWINDPHAPTSKYVTTSSQGLRIRQGWQIEEHGKVVLGEYLHLDIDETGNGAFRRNLSTVYPLYIASRGGVTIIANRKLVAATALSEKTTPSFNERYVACTIGCGWPLGANTLFDGVEVIRAGAEPKIKLGEITRPPAPDDPWDSADLAKAYREDRDRFWNDRIRELDRVAELFFAPDGRPLLTGFPLSGGKDSRLLFAVLNRHQRFRDVPISTHGSLYQHDVVVAATIAQHYNMKHEVRDSVFQTIDLERMLPEHLFLTEGRSSPSDALTWRAEKSPGIQAIGHELGLRDVIDSAPAEFTVNASFLQMKKLFGNFDRLDILTSPARQSLADMFRQQLEAYYQTTKDPGNVAWRLYMENRVLHYVSLIKMKDEAQKHSPYMLMTDPIVQASYTLGLAARLEERIHYELLRRLDPWLTYDCPFGAQRWPMALRIAEGGAERFAPAFPVFATKKAPPKGTYAAFDANRAAFRDFIMDTVGKLNHVVDRTRVEAALARPAWSAHEMGALWYLAQFCGGTGADWRLLSPLHRDERPAYFPPVKYSNGSRDQGGETASLNEIYRDIVPSAAFSLARHVQAKELLRDANELWALKKHGPAFQLYAAAATLGEPYAYFILGRCYLQGDVVAQDQREALRLLNLAKSKGVSAAATLLAACYANGNAVPKSKEQALALYEEAVSLGDFWALERIAELKQADGSESARDWKRLEDALLDYTLTRTHAHASYLLGLIYLEGRAGKSDPARGLSHLQTARDLGSRVAVERLARLSQAA